MNKNYYNLIIVIQIGWFNHIFIKEQNFYKHELFRYDINGWKTYIGYFLSLIYLSNASITSIWVKFFEFFTFKEVFVVIMVGIYWLKIVSLRRLSLFFQLSLHSFEVGARLKIYRNGDTQTLERCVLPQGLSAVPDGGAWLDRVYLIDGLGWSDFFDTFVDWWLCKDGGVTLFDTVLLLLIIEEEATEGGVFLQDEGAHGCVDWRSLMVGFVGSQESHISREINLKWVVIRMLIIWFNIEFFVETSLYFVSVVVCFRCFPVSSVEDALNLTARFITQTSPSNVKPPICVHLQLKSVLIQLIDLFLC